mgnify:CR=1 FL=1|tara:strand:+ start:639 stop:830 length:192 start_codon:yes stop_codon:yes gene_type:complete
MTIAEEEPMERLAYSINEFANAARLSRPTVYRMIRDGELKTAKVRGRQLVPVAEARRIFGEVA